MRIRWTPDAANLQRISDYLRDHHPNYRLATIRKVYAAIQSLTEWPHLGRPGREEGTWELLFPPLPYVAVYRAKEQSIKVLRIYHGAQDRGSLSAFWSRRSARSRLVSRPPCRTFPTPCSINIQAFIH